jgi:3-hydroxyacyl-[acyl-carrier-protein] dehydratase
MPQASYDTTALQSLLPHRYPFLLVDRVDVIDAGQHVVGLKQLTGGEWWMGPESTVAMPFTLILEALAQTSGALMPGLIAGITGAVAYFMGADRVRFRHRAEIGDQLQRDVTLRQWRRGVCRTRGLATVNGTVVLTADLTTIVRAS